MEIRYLAAGLLAFALLAPTGAAEPLVDQIDNGGFEDWEGDTPAEWRNVSGETERTDDAVNGSAALLNAVGDVTQTTLAQEVSLDNDDAPIVPNAEYEITFAADLNAGSGEAPDAYGQIVWKNALGEESRTDRVTISVSDGYVEYADSFRAPADATAADIQLHLVRDEITDPTDANLKVDNVAFGPADQVPE